MVVVVALMALAVAIAVKTQIVLVMVTESSGSNNWCFFPKVRLVLLLIFILQMRFNTDLNEGRWQLKKEILESF